LFGAETCRIRKVDKKCVEIFEMWCWRRVEKISWTDRVRNEVLQRVTEERNVLQTIKRRKANWNCLLKHIIEGKVGGRIEVTGDEEKDVSSYWMTVREREDTVN
jgi:hypothetical protein